MDWSGVKARFFGQISVGCVFNLSNKKILKWCLALLGMCLVYRLKLPNDVRL